MAKIVDLVLVLVGMHSFFSLSFMIFHYTYFRGHATIFYLSGAGVDVQECKNVSASEDISECQHTQE